MSGGKRTLSKKTLFGLTIGGSNESIEGLFVQRWSAGTLPHNILLSSGERENWFRLRQREAG